MTTLQLALVLGLAAVVSVSAEGCTPLGRECVEGATCEDKKCICPNGTSGDGRFCCFKEGFDRCVICEDPKIVLFPRPNQLRTAIFLPCKHRLSKFYVPMNDSDNVCRIKVFGLSKLVPKGFYYEEEVEIALFKGYFADETNIPGDPDDVPFMTYLKAFFRLTRNGVEWTTHDYGWAAPGNSWSNKPWGVNFTITLPADDGDCIINISYDSDNIQTWSVPDCESKVKFRPYVPGQLPQIQIPGVAILSPPTASFNGSWCRFPEVLCARPEDDPDSIIAAAHSYDMTLNQYVLFQMLRLPTYQIRGEYKQQCVESYNSFKACKTLDAKKKAVKDCMFLTANAQVVACINGLPASITSMDLFQKCLRYKCTQDYYACSDIEIYLNSCASKDIPVPDFKCSEFTVV